MVERHDTETEFGSADDGMEGDSSTGPQIGDAQRAAGIGHTGKPAPRRDADFDEDDEMADRGERGSSFTGAGPRRRHDTETEFGAGDDGMEGDAESGPAVGDAQRAAGVGVEPAPEGGEHSRDADDE